MVRVSSLKAVKEFMTILDNALIAPHQASILRCVAEIGLSGAVKEDSLVLVLEVFTDAVNVSLSCRFVVAEFIRFRLIQPH